VSSQRVLTSHLLHLHSHTMAMYLAVTHTLLNTVLPPSPLFFLAHLPAAGDYYGSGGVRGWVFANGTPCIDLQLERRLASSFSRSSNCHGCRKPLHCEGPHLLRLRFG
jgi:hypothetical protein